MEKIKPCLPCDHVLQWMYQVVDRTIHVFVKEIMNFPFWSLLIIVKNQKLLQILGTAQALHVHFPFLVELECIFTTLEACLIFGLQMSNGTILVFAGEYYKLLFPKYFSPNISLQKVPSTYPYYPCMAYLPTHLVDFHGKCIGKYIIHGSLWDSWSYILAIFGHRPPCFLSTGPMSSDLPFWTRELAFCEFTEFPTKRFLCFFLEICAGTNMRWFHVSLCIFNPDFLGKWSNFDQRIFQMGWNH